MTFARDPPSVMRSPPADPEPTFRPSGSASEPCPPSSRSHPLAQAAGRDVRRRRGRSPLEPTAGDGARLHRARASFGSCSEERFERRAHPRTPSGSRSSSTTSRPAANVATATNQQRPPCQWVREQGIDRLLRGGPRHLPPGPRRGGARRGPAIVVIGTDSHSTTYGAVVCLRRRHGQHRRRRVPLGHRPHLDEACPRRSASTSVAASPRRHSAPRTSRSRSCNRFARRWRRDLRRPRGVHGLGWLGRATAA